MVVTTPDWQCQTRTLWHLSTSDCDSDLRGHSPLSDFDPHARYLNRHGPELIIVQIDPLVGLSSLTGNCAQEASTRGKVLVWLLTAPARPHLPPVSTAGGALWRDCARADAGRI